MAQLATVLLVALIAFLSGYWTSTASQTPAQPVEASKYEDRLIELDREAIERAYVTQVQHLFEVWMKDATGQPKRATTGVNQARRAFVDSMRAIDERERRQQEK